MARLKDDFAEFDGRHVQVIAVGPDGPAQFRKYWRDHEIPIIGIPDPEHQVARLYRQEVNVFKLGRMPLVIIVDASGLIRYAHRADSMADIPENGALLEAIECIQSSKAPSEHPLDREPEG